ncbi:MAG: hypothetical protein ACI4SE_07600 [Lachnospiraceae bacterium]
MKQKWICICFAFFLIIGIWLSELELVSKYEGRYSSVEEYIAAGNEYHGMKLDEAAALLQEQMDMAQQVQTVVTFYQMGVMDFEEAAKQLAKSGYNVTEPEQINYEVLGKRKIGEELILEEMLLLQQYPDYLAALKQGTSGLSQIGFFSQDTYVEQVRQKAMRDYGDLEVSVDIWYQNAAAKEFLKNRIIDAMCFLFLIMVVMLLYTEEREKGHLTLTRITANGKRHFFIQKSLALLGYVCITVVVYEAVLLLYYVLRLGTPTWDAPIQSISAFEMCRYGFSVGQTVICSVLLKIVAFYSLLQLLSIIACLLSKSRYLVGVTALIAVLAFLGKYTGNINSDFGWLNYFNPINLSDATGMLTSYQTIRVIDTPVSASLIIFICLIGVLFFSFLAGSFGYGKISQRVYRYSQRKDGYVLKKVGKQYAKHTLLGLELRKLLFVYHLWIPILSILLILFGSYLYSSDITLSRKESLYQEYMKELNGPLTSSKEQFLSGERKKFAQLEELRNQLLEEENSAILLQHIEGMLVKKEAFEMVETQYRRILQGEEEDVFLYENGYLYLFGEKEDQKASIGILAGIFVIVLIIPCFVWIEMEKEASNLVRTTEKGRKKLLKAQYAGYYILILVLFAGVYFGDMTCIFRQFGTYGLDQKMRNIDGLTGLFQERSIAFGLLLIALIRMVGLALCVLIGMAIMYISRDYLKGMAVCGICFLLPYVIYINRFEFMKLYFLNSFLTGNVLFNLIQKGETGRLLFVLGQTFAVAGAALAILRKEADENGIATGKYNIRIRKN